MKIHAEMLVNLGGGLQMLSDVLSGTQPTPTIEWMKNYFDGVGRDLDSFGLFDLADSARRLKKDVGSVKNVAIGIRAHELRVLIESRLEAELFLWVPLHRADSYRQKDPYFGDSVAGKFASASYDIAEAGKCFACGRWTASVMHCMRALEHGLRALCLTLDLPFGEKTWQRSLEAIEKRVSVLDSQVKQKAAWRKKRQFYTEAVAEFKHFKDAWRNHAAHGIEHYDEERAKKIVEHTRNFMQVLATRLKEKKPK